MANTNPVIIKIKRQDTPNSTPYWDEFELPYKPGRNVISALIEIAANPVTRTGKQTTPITYDSNCLEEICGSCAMLINGRARMACSALIDHLDQPLRLEPFSKFPVVRDLAVDRSVLFENLKALKAWIPVDGSYDLGSGPRVSPEEQENCRNRTAFGWHLRCQPKAGGRPLKTSPDQARVSGHAPRGG